MTSNTSITNITNIPNKPVSSPLSITQLISYVLENLVNKDQIPSNIPTPPVTIISTKNSLADSKYAILQYGKTRSISDFSPKIRNIFDPYISDMKRHGAYVNNINSNNMTLLYSILFCIDSNIKNIKQADMYSYINDFNNSMLNLIYTDDLFNVYKYTELNWSKRDLIAYIKEYKNNVVTLRFLSDLLNINIFLLNINKDSIYSIYPEQTFNMFKNSVFLAYSDNTFEPVTYKNICIFSYNTDPLKRILNVEKQYIDILEVNLNNKVDVVKKQFQVEPEDLSKYLANKEVKEEIKEEIKENKEDNKEDNKFEEQPNEDDIDIQFTDVDDTEVYTEPKKNVKDIFYKNQSDDKKVLKNKKADKTGKAVSVSSKEDSKKHIKPDLALLKDLSPKMKLLELQELAKKCNVNTIINNKPRLKQDIYNDLSNLL